MSRQKPPAQRRPQVTPRRQERIMLVRGDGLGDAVLSMGFLESLRRARPAAHLTLAVREGLEPVYEGCPWIDHLMPFPRVHPSMTAFESGLLVLMSARAMGRIETTFDWLVDLQPGNHTLYGSMHVTTTVPAKRRIAAPMWGAIERAAQETFYDQILDFPACHEVERYGALAEQFGGERRDPRFWDLAPQRRRALDTLGRSEEWWATPKLYMHLGASDPRRRWPVERFTEIARRLAPQDVEVVVVGGPEEAPLVQAVAAAAGPRALPLAGTLSPLELAAVMQGGGVFLGNDSGPMHVAAVAGLPVVEISVFPRTGRLDHGNAPQRFGPWGVPSVIVQPEDFLGDCKDYCVGSAGAHCIGQITVDEVWEALTRLVSFEAPAELEGAA